MITHKRLKELLDYDPITGIFTNKVARGGKAPKGKRLRPDNTGSKGRKYGRVSLEGKPYNLHILAVFYVTGKYPQNIIDHIDRNTTNNIYTNLREATKAQNGHNSIAKGGSSKFKGVSLYKATGKWTAQIHIEGKKKHLGYFILEKDAAKAYNIAAKEHFGDFAFLNEGVS